MEEERQLELEIEKATIMSAKEFSRIKMSFFFCAPLMTVKMILIPRFDGLNCMLRLVSGQGIVG